MTAMSSQLSPRIFLRNGVTLSPSIRRRAEYIQEKQEVNPPALQVRLPAIRRWRLPELPIFFRKPCFSGEDLEALELARENTIKGAIFLAFLISLSFWERVVIRCS
jgi:hypothetical protein